MGFSPVYDLKAVNPHRATLEDRTTPGELLEKIEAKGREADAALAELRRLIADNEPENVTEARSCGL